MKPYYEHAGITIYHGDCRDVLPRLPDVDAVVTDPPYGISYQPTFKRHNGDPSEWNAIEGDAQVFDPWHLLSFKNVVIWGANHFSDQLPSGGWFIWDKRCSIEADRMLGVGFEMAWVNQRIQKMFRILHGGIMNADAMRNDKGQLESRRWHPTQKPIVLMEKCILEIGVSGSVCDPYCGSGTTLIAAKKIGKSAIGIEIEEKYCEIAAKRLSQEVFDFSASNHEQILGGEGPIPSGLSSETCIVEKTEVGVDGRE